MASTYTSSNRLEKMTTGENSGTWGTKLDTVLDLIDEAVDGYIAIAMGDANVTLTASNAVADQSRPKVLKATGSHTATRDLVAPAVEKVYLIHNATTGGQSIRIKTSGGVAVTIAASAKSLVYCDGTDFVEIVSNVGNTSINTLGTITTGTWNGTVIGTAYGGTGSGTLSTARTNLGLGTGDSPQFTAVNIGAATDTTITRVSAGVIAVEGSTVLTGAGSSAITTVGTITSGTWTGTTIAVANGGTGATSASGARTALGLGTAAVKNTSTSGNNVPLLDGTNTWSASQTISTNGAPTFTVTGTAGANMVLNASASTNRLFYFQTAGSPRWRFLVDATAESGSNAGSDFSLDAVDDAGSFLSRPISITRSTGVVNIASLTLSTALPISEGGTGSTTAASAATALGLGTGSSPQFTAVNIGSASDTTISRVSAGVIQVESNTLYMENGTDVAVADGGTGASTAASARTNLGLGTISTQASSSVSITGGTITGITDLAVADGGTGSSTAATGARTLLNGLGTTKGNILWYDGSNWSVLAPP